METLQITTTKFETQTAKFLTKEIRVGKYYLRFGNFGGKDKNSPTLQFGRYITVGKNKGRRAQIWGYYYTDENKRDQKALTTYNDLKAKIYRDVKAKEESKKAKENFDLQSLVGKVFYNSWGYDQTNVDFYQVLGVTKAMVILRAVYMETVPDSGGMMCDRVRPIENSFIGNEFKKPIKVQITDGTSTVYIPFGNRHSLSEYKNGEHGTYRSWYA
jgi:hypothetical protein